MLEFQSVVLAGGRGSRLPDVGGDIPKCLLPVGPYPILWYSLNLLEKIGFQDTMIIVLSNDKSDILNALEKCPLKIKYELVPIPSDKDWGTADSLRHIYEKIISDLIVVSGDLITDINMTEVINLYRKHDASLVSLFLNNGPEEYIELPGPKTKVKPERDLVGLDEETGRLVFLASASDFDEDFEIPRVLIQKHNSVKIYSRLLDAHVYILKKWVLDFLVEQVKFSTLKGELLPYIVKKQLSKPKSAAEEKNASMINVDLRKDIFKFASHRGYEKEITQFSSYNDHSYGMKALYHEDLIRCYGFIPKNECFGMRINTLSAFYLVNSKINSQWDKVAGSAMSNRLNPTSEVRTKQIDDLSTVGDQSILSEKTSIKNSFIGSNCTVENKVRISNCIIMNNVTIKEGCVLQDCILYTGATVEAGTSLQHCLVGPHHSVATGTNGNHQIFSETRENMITLG